MSLFSDLSTIFAAYANKINSLKGDLEDLQEAVDWFDGLSDAVKEALLDCFLHVDWVDDHGQDYYDALEAALYGQHLINGYLYKFDNDLLSSGTKDFGLIGQANYADGVDGKAYHHKVTTEGDSTTDVGAIYKTGLTSPLPFAGTSDFTISAWFKSTTKNRGVLFGFTNYESGGSITGNNYFFDSITLTPNTGISLVHATAGRGYCGIFMQYTKINDPDSLVLTIHNGDFDKSSFVRLDLPNSYSTLEWHHHALTRNGNNFYFFIDGQLIFTATSSKTIYDAGQACVGARFGTTQETSNAPQAVANACYIDDFYIANKCKWTANFDPTNIRY